MTHQEYTNKWNNQKQERVDSTNLNQCFDLAVGYCIDVLGLPQDIFSGLKYAYQIFLNPTQKTGSTFDFIINQDWAVPKKGDIIVWSNKYGPAGHVAVVDQADVNSFTAFSQNDPVGSPCVMKTYSYTNVLGWLRKIGVGADITAYEKQIADLKETEKRLIKEKDEAIKRLEKESLDKLALAESRCLIRIKDEKNIYRQKIISFAQSQ